MTRCGSFDSFKFSTPAGNDESTTAARILEDHVQEKRLPRRHHHHHHHRRSTARPATTSTSHWLRISHQDQTMERLLNLRAATLAPPSLRSSSSKQPTEGATTTALTQGSETKSATAEEFPPAQPQEVSKSIHSQDHRRHGVSPDPAAAYPNVSDDPGPVPARSSDPVQKANKEKLRVYSEEMLEAYKDKTFYGDRLWLDFITAFGPLTIQA